MTKKYSSTASIRLPISNRILNNEWKEIRKSLLPCKRAVGRSIVNKKSDGSNVKESTDSSTTLEEDEVKGHCFHCFLSDLGSTFVPNFFPFSPRPVQRRGKREWIAVRRSSPRSLKVNWKLRGLTFVKVRLSSYVRLKLRLGLNKDRTIRACLIYCHFWDISVLLNLLRLGLRKLGFPNGFLYLFDSTLN